MKFVSSKKASGQFDVRYKRSEDVSFRRRQTEKKFYFPNLRKFDKFLQQIARTHIDISDNSQRNGYFGGKIE